MTDIVERLRANYSDTDSSGEAHMALEAANEIERLRTALKDVASTLDWQRPGSMEGRLREVALAALKPPASELELIISNLRHAYMQLAADTVRLQKEFADGLIAPQIRKLEKMVNEGNDPCKATTRHIFPDA